MMVFNMHLCHWGNKIGMAIGTALLAALLGKYGYVANQVQNPAVLSIMRHSFTTIPGILWIVTAIVLFFLSPE